METYYKGDDIPIYVLGDDTIDLENKDFNVYIYKNLDYNKDIKITKSLFTKTDINSYLGYLSTSTISNENLGIYTIEIEAKTSSNKNIILQYANAFNLIGSASYNI